MGGRRPYGGEGGVGRVERVQGLGRLVQLVLELDDAAGSAPRPLPRTDRPTDLGERGRKAALVLGRGVTAAGIGLRARGG